MSILSVDLGTSNTVAVLSAHGRPPRVVEVEGSAAMPSAVFAAEDGRLVVGREAERRARLDPARFEPNPKRRVDEGTLLLGDRVVPVTEAFAAVLRKVAEETSRQLGGARPDEVRLTHPAQWGPVRRNVLLSAARQAGLGTALVLVPEPVAAAAHFASFPGVSLARGQALAVYDLGAGTFDVAVVAGSVVLAEAGLPDLGGLDVDQALLSYVGRQVSGRDPGGWQRLLRPESTGDRRAQRALREDVRAAKESLSGHPQTEVPLPEQFGDVLVTRPELEALIRPNLLRSVELLDATVRSAGLSRDQLAGVYLVGGSSRIPLVATLIAEQLRIMPTNLDQPETAVALGAHHIAAEGTSLRTDNFVGAMPGTPAIASSDERTAHIAPPPRPSVRPSQSVAPPRGGQPPTAAVMPASFPRFPASTMASPQPLSNKPKKNSRKRWAILIAAGLVAALVVAGVVGQIIETMSHGTDDVTLAHPKEVPDNMSCDSIIPIDQVGEEFGVDAQEFDGSERCHWAAQDSANNLASADLSLDVWYTAEESFILHGNSARKETLSGSCYVEIAIQADKALQVRAMAQEGRNPCDLAEALLAIAFDNIPDS